MFTHSGGELALSHQSQDVVIRLSELNGALVEDRLNYSTRPPTKTKSYKMPKTIKWGAFFGDVEHEVN
jgi:hypothetical protein